MATRKLIIGRKDFADFEKLDLFGIDVKIDSGAYTSSFHCHKIEQVIIDGKDYIKCNFLDPCHPQYHEKEFIFDDFKLRKIKSSNGFVEKRVLISTEITIFKNNYPIELSLTERMEMKHPVLLGRKFLSKRFLIDTSRKNLSLKKRIIQIRKLKKK
jgi:hypothetical protein